MYSKVVAYNYLFHQEIYADITQVLGKIHHSFSLLDLGCGDATCLAPVLAKLPVISYCGVDLSPAALELAKQNLSVLPCTVEFCHTDLLQALRNINQRYDVIFSSFAVHHLSFGEKTEFFQLAIQHLNKDGILLLVDAVREESEDLPTYLNAYCDQVHNQWHHIDLEEKEFICRHVTTDDFAETASTLQMMAVQAGFSSCQKVSKYSMNQVFCFKVD
ncbi:MAG: hypothetical protein BWK78_09530 [Thiotrichaceae bacterium IS1]|nr:MAG: hypothetical protein BWK78_09530 [Thiotrichaceae bacterium IS1]